MLRLRYNPGDPWTIPELTFDWGKRIGDWADLNNWDKTTSLLLRGGADPNLGDHRNRIPQDLTEK